MNFSLKSKISLLFLFAVISVACIAVFVYFQKDYEIERQVRQFVYVSLSSAYNQTTNKLDAEDLINNGFVKIEDKTLSKEILAIYNEKRVGTFGRHNRKMRSNVAAFRPNVMEYKSDFYAIIHIDGNNVVFQVSPFHANQIFAYMFFISMITVLALLYFTILRSIKPLRALRDKIREFSDGNDNINCRINGNDEIAEVANEFDSAVKKIRALKEARQLFLRNIMHELKTPIARGKLSVEMLDQQNPYRQTLSKVFLRQENLLNEFARIEQLGTGEITLEKGYYKIRDIIDCAFDIIGENAQNIESDIDEFRIHADFDLLATAFKNILDNAVLYSNDKKAVIVSKNGITSISNNGKALEFTLEEYRKPFLLQGKKQKESRGFGFGLFISLKIFDLHNIKTSYKNKEGKSTFTITA